MHASNSKASNSKTVVRGKVLFWRLLPAVALLLASAVPALAQEVDGDFEGETQYADKEGNPRDIKDPTSKERRKVTELFAVGKASSKEEEQAFEDLAHYYVNALTLKKNISVLQEKRKELKKYLAMCGQKNRTVTDLHTRFNELTLTTCRQVGEDPKYPRAIRYNCMLMIGELDSDENQPGTANSTVPWATATTALLEFARNEKQYVALRLGAVIGLKRHTLLGVAPSVQPQLAEALLGVLGTPLGDENNQGHIWLRLAAADVLHEALKRQPPLPVDQAKFAAALAARIDEEQMPNWARAKLAGELGKLQGRNVPAGQIPATARSLAGLMFAICQASPFAADAEADAQKDKPEDAAKKGSDKKAGEKKADKKGTEGKGEGKKDDKKDEKPEAAANAAAAQPPSPAVQKINAEEMIWQLSQIRLALYGKDAPVGKEKGADPALGLRAAAAEDSSKTMIDKVVGHIDELVPLLVGVPEAKDVFTKLADNLRTTIDDLDDLLAVPASQEQDAPPAAQPVAGRPRPPAGNQPAETSATKN